MIKILNNAIRAAILFFLIMACGILFQIRDELREIKGQNGKVIEQQKEQIQYQDVELDAQILAIESIHTLIEATMQSGETNNIINIR